MKRPTPAAILVVVALAGCSAAPQSTAPAGDNSRSSLDWPGVYAGTIPCTDCEGIRMRIELRSDGTFVRTLTYLRRAARHLRTNPQRVSRATRRATAFSVPTS